MLGPWVVVVLSRNHRFMTIIVEPDIYLLQTHKIWNCSRHSKYLSFIQENAGFDIHDLQKETQVCK